MKIKRFLAKNMRDAIRMVREEQGADAVILSNHRVAGGVEVVAATDYDAALMQQASRRGVPPEPPPATPTPTRSEDQRPVATSAPAAAPASPELQQLRRELGGMKRMLETQIAGMAWRELQEHPQKLRALQTMINLGIEPRLAREIIAELPAGAAEDAERARFLPLGLLSRRIPVVSADPIHEGGIIALVGPTGVGKTTTIAKLAARYAEAHGLRDIALVAMDHHRIGAAEQLYTYARLLGVPVHAVTPQQSLKETLARVADRKLVLIDTVGMSPRDGALAGQIDALHAAHPKLRAYLTIAANNQTLDQDEAVRRFGVGKLSGCIISKCDETSRIGGALSVAIRHNLPITYFTDGQRVPEDLHLAQADALVIRAMQLARTTPAPVNDDTLAMQFAHAIETGAHAHV